MRAEVMMLSIGGAEIPQQGPKMRGSEASGDRKGHSREPEGKTVWGPYKEKGAWEGRQCTRFQGLSRWRNHARHPARCESTRRGHYQSRMDRDSTNLAR
jgi:hypothetical protein